MKISDIGKQIRQVLSGNTALNTHVHGNIWPYSTESEIKAPWVVYDNINVEYSRTKDGSTISSASFTVICCDRTYEKSVQCADLIADAINNQSGFCVTSVASSIDTEQGVIHELNITIDYE